MRQSGKVKRIRSLNYFPQPYPIDQIRASAQHNPPHFRHSARRISPCFRVSARHNPPHFRLSARRISPHFRHGARHISPHFRVNAQHISPHFRHSARHISPHFRISARHNPPHFHLSARHIPPRFCLSARHISPHFRVSANGGIKGGRLLLAILLLLLAACAPSPSPSPTPPTATPNPTTAPLAAPTRTPAPATTASPTPAPTTCAETGSIQRLTLNSIHLHEPLVTHVYLPPCFNPHPAQSYPLLILLHGQGADAEEWQRLGIAAAADRLIAAGVIPPLVIAMPYERQSLKDPFESGFDDALLDELLPRLEDDYAACAGRACRALGGLSRGAAWALYIGLSHPETFAALGAHSYPAFYGDFNRLPLLLREIAPGHLPRIWLDTGERDRYLAQARQYHVLLDQYQVPHAWQLFPGEHDEAYWSAHVEDYLRWYGKMVK